MKYQMREKVRRKKRKLAAAAAETEANRDGARSERERGLRFWNAYMYLAL